MGAEPLRPAGEIVATVVDDFEGRALAARSFAGDKGTDAIVPARVGAQGGTTVFHKPLGQEFKEGRAVKIAAGAVDQADGVEGRLLRIGIRRLRRSGTRSASQGAIQRGAVRGGGTNEFDEHIPLRFSRTDQNQCTRDGSWKDRFRAAPVGTTALPTSSRKETGNC